MDFKKESRFFKYCLLASSSGLILIGITLIPISKKAYYWNKCFDNTFNWIIKNEKDLYAWEKKAQESLAVAVCNGAVHEPKFKIK